jgi:hypothetical protein
MLKGRIVVFFYVDNIIFYYRKIDFYFIFYIRYIILRTILRMQPLGYGAIVLYT